MDSPRSFPFVVLAVASLLFASTDSLSAELQEVRAGNASDLSVTLYRPPGRGEASINREDFAGFALVRETRLLRLPSGDSRVRFEGVADGIEASSAIVTGLAGVALEKNLDAELLSPPTLLAAARGKSLVLVRSNSKTGATETESGTLLSTNDGVVFQTKAGVEALSCSGLSETFSFSGLSDLSASPTLSVRVNTPRPVTTSVTLSYLATGFDWAANYTAMLSRDGKSLNLAAWVTLANGSSVSFPDARTQVVAGRVNHETDEIEPIDAGNEVIAKCWPQGSTASQPSYLEQEMPRLDPGTQMAPAPALQEVVLTAERRVVQEQLGDLKLYRIPERTTLASNESKQVRLLDRTSIPVSPIFRAEVSDYALAPDGTNEPASVWLQTSNTLANHLGIPLPSGHVSLLAATRDGVPVLLQESNIRDLAVNEELEIDTGESSDVRILSRIEGKTSNPADDRPLTWVVDPGSLRNAAFDDVRQVRISNGRSDSIPFELMLRLDEGASVVRADHPISNLNGHPTFRLTIPAQSSVTVRYQTGHQASNVVAR